MKGTCSSRAVFATAMNWMEFRGTQRRIQKAWLGARSGVHRRRAWVEDRPSPEKNEFSHEVACFGEF